MAITADNNLVFRAVAEGITEIAYGIHSEGELDFVGMYDEMSLVAMKTLRGYMVDLLPWREFPLSLVPTSLLTVMSSQTRSSVVSGSQVQARCKALEQTVHGLSEHNV